MKEVDYHKNVVVPALQHIADKLIIELMLTSETIQQWNENRESAKVLRDAEWISTNIDAANLIARTKIKTAEVAGV
jgi:hypothetical protein